MKKLAAITLLLSASIGWGQHLTTDQKTADFKYLASLYASEYAPFEWKKQLFGFDLFKIQPWLDRVGKTTTDLDFYEICIEYVASLKDTHDRFTLSSDFFATLGFGTDIYDGAALIETVNRTQLPLKDFPFTTGDELVSVDGKSVEQLLGEFAKYAWGGNPIANKRQAAGYLTQRSQSVLPHAPDVGDTAVVTIKRQNGNVETYTVPVVKTGTPLEVGPVPSPKTVALRKAALRPQATGNPSYMRALDEITYSGVTNQPEMSLHPEGLLNLGSRTPIFVNSLNAANGFTRRLGGAGTDFFYSGTFKRDDLVIGYIRIPNYAPASQATQLRILEGEIAYFSANTDGLIVDEMRNTGGSLCFGEEVIRRLVPYQFTGTGFQVRATWSRLLGFYNSMINAKSQGAATDVIERYENLYKEISAANAAGKIVTNTVPLCSSSQLRDAATDANGANIAYRKPIMMLVDEFTLSTGDSAASMFQDARRGILFGQRTMGAGGNNTIFDAGAFTEGLAGMTIGLQVRKAPVATSDYPYTAYSENVGVRPEIVDDYMTKANLLQSGAPFVHDFLEAMYAYIKQQGPTN